MTYLIVILSVALLAVCVVAGVCKEPPRWWKCAYCGWWFSSEGETTPSAPGASSEPASHGMCPECGAKFKASLPSYEELDRVAHGGQGEPDTGGLRNFHPMKQSTRSLIFPGNPLPDRNRNLLRTGLGSY